jgi:DNA-binding MarR family transcriptional regulator
VRPTAFRPTGAPALPAELEGSAGYLMAKATQRGNALMEGALSPYGLKVRHYGVLLVVRDTPRSQHEVGELLAIDRTTMAAIVDDLERLGLAERRPHPANRRGYQVHLTNPGSEQLEALITDVQQADLELTAGLTAGETEQLGKLLHAVAAPLLPS